MKRTSVPYVLLLILSFNVTALTAQTIADGYYLDNNNDSINSGLKKHLTP